MTIAIALAGVAAIANWCSKLLQKRALETVFKPLTTVLVIWVAITTGGDHAPTVLAVVGLSFCLVGDIALLEVVDRFVIGLASFLVAHLVFVAMFASLGLDRPWWGVIPAAVVALHMGTLGRRLVAGAAATEATLRIPVMAYIATIAAMAVVAVMTGRWWAVVGATFFVASDTLLGWAAFVTPKQPAQNQAAQTRWLAVAVMITYHGAIVGLALSLK